MYKKSAFLVIALFSFVSAHSSGNPEGGTNKKSWFPSFNLNFLNWSCASKPLADNSSRSADRFFAGYTLANRDWCRTLCVASALGLAGTFVLSRDVKDPEFIKTRAALATSTVGFGLGAWRYDYLANKAFDDAISRQNQNEVVGGITNSTSPTATGQSVDSNNSNNGFHNEV